MQQSEYNRQLQEGFAATRRLPPPTPSAISPARDTLDRLKDLGELRSSGTITDEEFAAAKAKVLGPDSPDR